METNKKGFYDYGEKNFYRRWVWNRIKESLQVPLEDAIGVFFLGDNAGDVEIFKEKGFKKHNLLGLDIDKKKVSYARRNGIYSMHCNLIDLLEFFPDDKIRFDFVYADFCCGFNEKIDDLFFALKWGRGIKQGTVVAINLLRGREHDELGKINIAGGKSFIEGNNITFLPGQHTKPIGDIKNHRCWVVVNWIVRANNIMKKNKDEKEYSLDKINLGLKATNYHTKNGLGVMDCTVFTWPWDAVKISTDKHSKMIWDKTWNKDCLSLSVDIKNKVSAWKAIRTMRLHG